MTLTDAVVAAFIGAAVAGVIHLISTHLNNKAADRRMKTNLERSYAEHFIPRKVETLSNLYSSLITSRGVFVGSESGFSPDDPKWFVPIDTGRREVENALAQALVYLQVDERIILRKYLKEYGRMKWNRLEDIAAHSKGENPPPFDRGKFDSAYEDALSLMEKILNPELVKGIEPED